MLPQAKEVRLAALDVLTGIFEKESAKALSPFTARFKDRIVQMAADVENAVAVKAINLCTILYKKSFVQLDEACWTPVYDALVTDDSDVGTAAAGFIGDFYLKNQLTKDFDEDKTNKGICLSLMTRHS